jgi:hypothetical protein
MALLMRPERIRQVLRLKRELHRIDAAAQIHPHRGWNDRGLGRDHAADRRADSGVHVGHRGDVAVDDRQPRDVFQLLARRRLEVGRPHFHRHAAGEDFFRDGHEALLGQVQVRQQTPGEGFPHAREIHPLAHGLGALEEFLGT